MALQSTMYQKQNIDVSAAPWTMHEFFAGSGLVAYGLKGMFAPVWANDISEQKAAVYEANFGCDRFILDDIKNIKGSVLPFAHLSWASFPCQDYPEKNKNPEAQPGILAAQGFLHKNFGIIF